MCSFVKLFELLLLAQFVFSAPTDVEERATIDTSSHCGLFDSVTAGSYSLLLDQWGAAGATSGSDCANLVSLSGTTLAWKTTWTWTGGTGVKSFTDINVNSGLNQQLGAISTMPSTWTWSYSTSSVVADVAYDLFTSNSAGGAAVNEIMIWLAAFGGAGPISAEFNSAGQAVPIESNLSLAGHTWNLYFGSNGANNVYSFLPTSGTITSFSGDINLFFKYLTANQGVSTSQFLTTAQGGTEATSGSATFTTSAFSLVIN
ncbi:concanavalin A-like lectin/glucanase [Mycena galopus ATCC 62051]|nr:concanavalin A-like lectin/glucanase [Mycena galopus ATCC 62051]